MKNKTAPVLAVLLAGIFVYGQAAAQQQTERQKEQQSQQSEEQQKQQAKERQSDYLSADKFENMSVKGPQGEEVGTVAEVIVDKKSGQLAYFVLARGGVGGMGEEKYIVPWNAMKPDAEGKELVLQVPREKLRLAPRGDDVEKQLTRQMAQEIAQHYGVAPYWEESGTPQQQAQPGQQPLQTQPQQPPVQTQPQQPPVQTQPQQPPAQTQQQ